MKMTKSIVQFLRQCAAACLLLIIAFTISVPAQRRTNVVLILADDMGYADIGSYGAKDIRTPHLDRLAREGVRLTDFYANGPVCTPTRAALMTGRYQQRVGLEWATVPNLNPDAGLPASETTVARMLKNKGYRTALFGKWHLGYKPEFNPTVHGFEEFFGLLGGNVDMNSHENRFGTLDCYEGTQVVKKSGYLTDLITDRAVAFINKNASAPFFLYVPYNAVHWPFQPPGNPNDVRTVATWFDGDRRAYARMLEAMDAGIGRILAALDKQGLARDTLVIFTNDNGGERLSDNAPLFHHKATLWEGGIRVPCLLRWPAQLPAGKTVRQAAISMDLTATILAAAGVLPERELEGINLLPFLQGKQPAIERTFFWRIDRAERKQKAVRHGQWKYVLDGGVDVLFDLSRDPGERQDLSHNNRQLVAELRAKLAAWEKDVDKSAPKLVVK
jgi:arylsulfatase A-like enzyme